MPTLWHAMRRSRLRVLALSLPQPDMTDAVENDVLSLLYGGDYHLFNLASEDIRPDSEEYELAVLAHVCDVSRPISDSFQDIADDNASAAVEFIHVMGPPTKPFHRVTRREIPAGDRDFVLKIMKLDHRDRPTAEQPLHDQWFDEESEDTREPLSQPKQD